MSAYIGDFPKCFTEFTEFSDKNICHYSKRARTCHVLCKRPTCHHSSSKTHVKDGIFKLTPIHASVIYQIPWIRWIHWKFCPFRKNSIVNQENHMIKQNVSPKVTPLVFHVCCGTLNSNQYKECECVMEFLLIHINFLTRISGYESGYRGNT